MQREFSLLGMGDASDSAVVAAIQSAPPAQVAKAVRAAGRAHNNSARGSRRAFMDRLSLLPPDIQRGVLEQGFQISDVSYYSVKDVSTRTQQRMFEDADVKKVGTTNLSGGKLEKGAYFCLCAIRLQLGTFATAGVYEPGIINFSDLTEQFLNGEFELKANGTTLFAFQSCEQFNTESRTDLTTATFVLDNPKMIWDQQNIDFTIEWSKPAQANKALKVTLLGSGIVKA